MFEIFNNSGSDVLELNILEEYVKYVTKKLKIEGAIFNIIMVDDKEIQQLNSTYRGIDKKTDVITFALEDEDTIVMPNEERVLGDIYISIDRAKEQANEFGHSLLRELSFLAVHGFYHLLGYDHMTPEDEKVMFKKQEEVLEAYGIRRES